MADVKNVFIVCNSDNKAGLTRNKCKNCVDYEEYIFGDDEAVYDILWIQGNNFGQSDLNGDGVLLFEEWKTWARDGMKDLSSYLC